MVFLFQKNDAKSIKIQTMTPVERGLRIHGKQQLEEAVQDTL